MMRMESLGQTEQLAIAFTSGPSPTLTLSAGVHSKE